MCTDLNVPIDEVDYYKNWYNSIGLGLATGHSWKILLETFPEKQDVIDYLRERYVVNAWWSPE